MSIRYIIRPAGIKTTPFALKQAFHAERMVRYPGPSRRLLSWERDFFLAYPPPYMIEEFRNQNADNSNNETLTGYERLHRLYSVNKPTQRTLLRELGFPTPNTFRGMGGLTANGPGVPSPDGAFRTTTYIARPLRHREGSGFRIVEDPTVTGSWNPPTEYLQELYPKTHEYRILIVRGEPLITLLKKVPEGTPVDTPWNHAHGASFVTVTNWENNRLRHTNVYDVIRANESFFKYLDLGGLDVLYNANDRSYVVCEINFCPSLSIQSNLEKVVSHALSVPR